MSGYKFLFNLNKNMNHKWGENEENHSVTAVRQYERAFKVVSRIIALEPWAAGLEKRNHKFKSLNF